MRLYSGSDKWIQGIRSDRQNAWITMDGSSWHCTGGSDQDNSQEKEMQISKMAVWGGHTNSCEMKSGQKKGEKEWYTYLMQSSKE